MELLSLIVYAGVTLGMILFHFLGYKGKYYEFPFWAGVVAAGWFLPQAIQGYSTPDLFPAGSYSAGLLFAATCNAMIWVGFSIGKKDRGKSTTWLAANFYEHRLFIVGAAMCVFGLYFQYKLQSLPEEVLMKGQWSGAAVKYLFFASVFQMGLVILLLLYYSKGKWMNPKILIFITPCMMLLMQAALIGGRRGVMMNLFSLTVVGFWLVRRFAVPKAALIGAVCAGLVFVNSISAYRSIMSDDDMPIGERISMAFNELYKPKEDDQPKYLGSEFKNYLHVIALYSTYGGYDFGGYHWNQLVFSFVPGQIVGREFKNSLMVTKGMSAREAKQVLLDKFGYEKSTGSTISGYADSFGSFGWLGGIKFMLIGMIMGALYRYAMKGSFLAQFLYVFMLGTAMHSITHGTNRILGKAWFYFLFMGYPLLLWAQVKAGSLMNKPEIESAEVRI